MEASRRGSAWLGQEASGRPAGECKLLSLENINLLARGPTYY